MSLIDTFNKPRWQHSDPEVRRAAIDELDDEAVLLDLISTDADPGVRAHALSRITDSDRLDELINTLPESLQKQARSQRLQQLLPDPDQLQAITSDETLVRIASLAEDQELLAAALGRVQSVEVLMEVAASHPMASIRLCAAQGIDNLEMLQQLLQQSKHKDKAVYRHCKELLDKHHLTERAEAERQAKIQQLIDKAVPFSESVYSPDFKSRYLSLKHHWQPLMEHASPEQAQQVEAALDICAKRLAKRSDAIAAEEEQKATISAANQEFPALLSELEEIDQAATTHMGSEEIADLNTRLNHIEERWVIALQLAHASSAQTDQCKTLLNQWRLMLQTEQRLLEKGSSLEKNHQGVKNTDRSDFLTLHRQLERTDKLIASLPWPESHASNMPEGIRQLLESKAALESQLAELKKREKQNLERLETAFEKLRAELKTNHFDNADREYKRLRNILRQLSPDQQHHHQHELRPLVARLSEIHDWQGFAIEPKKLDLCERMRALINSDDTPDILLGKIKALQKEWKSLGHLSPKRDQELWEEFRSAADQAYEPCKEAFAQRAVLQQENFERRMELIAQLVEYDKKMHWPDGSETGNDAPKPDWKLVQKTLDTARQAFRNIKPVDRKGERKSQKKLKMVCDRIYNHIKQEYERNITIKEGMISRAQSFAEMEDLDQAISQAKTIQREWKNVGMTPMRVDRKLWKKFRAACDAVFARLDEQREQVKQAMSEQVEQAESLVTQARALLESEDDEQRLHLKRDIGELHTALRGVDLPRTVQVQFSRQFSGMERDARNVISDIRKRQEQTRWQHLTQNMRACALKATDEKKAAKLWQEETDVPKGIEPAALETFWQQGPGDTPVESQREACIALEILFGLDSPADDKEARMAYQMKRLVEGMGGQQQVNSEQQLLEQIGGFIALRPSVEWVERFCSTVDGVKAPATSKARA